MTATPRLGITQLEEGQSLPEQVSNEAWRVLEQFASRGIVIDKDLATPPGSPADGDAYIVAAAATGAWTGWHNRIAFYLSTGWVSIIPTEGTKAYVQDENREYEWNAVNWAVPTTVSYEGGPPGTVPTVASLTWINQGTSTASDGTGALIIKPQVNNGRSSLVKAVPSAPFDVYCRVNLQSLSTAALTVAIDTSAGIVLRDSADSEIITFEAGWTRISGDEQNVYTAVVNRWTSDGVTYSATPIARNSGQMWRWLRVNVTSTTITFYVSMDGRNWHSIGTETISTFIDAVSQYGMCAAGDTNSTETMAMFSYFSTTAPA